MMYSVVAVESLIDPDLAKKVWPQSIVANGAFSRQLERRKKLLDHLNSVIDHLPRPDISLMAAIEQGYITQNQAADLYESLSDLLEFDRDYRRIIFYLPFEFLPSKLWYASEKKLEQALIRFRRAYMEVWKDMLFVQDVRANFVDGDVLEIEQRDGDLPRVVKAAHLIPKLVENGLIKINDIVALVEESRDPILRNSIADTFPVLSDLGFISASEIDRMERSGDRLVNSVAINILENTAIVKPNKTPAKTTTIPSLKEELIKDFSRIDEEDYGNITERRKSWLIQTKKQQAIDKVAEIIGRMIIEDSIASELIVRFLDLGSHPATTQALIEGIRKAIESAASDDLCKATELYAQYRDSMLRLWEKNNVELKEALLKFFRRLYRSGIVDYKQLASLGIVVPELAGPFSKNLELLTAEVIDIEKAVASIESDPELSRLIYPIITIFGSRLKGYGSQNSDIDLGIFVRPGVSFTGRKKLRDLLGKIFGSKKDQYGFAEFWLEKNKESLRVRDLSELDPSLGESHWTHVLFGAAWVGNEEAIRELFEKLLAPYLFETDEIIHGFRARNLHLEEMERDNLQYRLMHKGYEQFFPRSGGINTMCADKIDGTSMFWDSGYRQTATKLFISRVFLPKIL